MATTVAAAHDKKKVLGRGLNSLIPAARGDARAAAPAPAVPAGDAVSEIAIELVDPNPYETRTQVDEVSLEELAASVKVSGVLQPIVLRQLSGGRFQLVAGQRRLLASKKAGKSTVPAIVRTLSDDQAMEITIVENLQREDLNPMDQAQAFDMLANKCGLTQEQIAQRTGKDRATIANYMRLLRLPAVVHQQLRSNELSMGHARALMGLNSAEEISKCAQKVVQEALSVRATEKLVYDLLHPAPPKAVPERVVDPNVREAERTLQKLLGMRVRIFDRKGKGKVVLEYKTVEDFDRLMEVLEADPKQVN